MEDWCRDIQLYGGDRPTDPTNSFIRPAVTNRDSDVFNGKCSHVTFVLQGFFGGWGYLSPLKFSRPPEIRPTYLAVAGG